MTFPDYNNSDIRNEWKFAIPKNYRKSQLFDYKRVERFVPEDYDAPGENGLLAQMN